MPSDDLEYRILQELGQEPQASQRALAERMGLSLGKTHYCLRAVVEKGWVKMRNFRNSANKIAYLYQLTPEGVRAKARITRRFLDRKIAEYERLEKEIQRLRVEVESPGTGPVKPEAAPK